MHSMMVIIMRGLPGAGKSTFVRTNYPEAIVCSADNFLLDEDGKYHWTAERAIIAHSKCKNLFTASMKARAPLTVVDNCNLTYRDLSFYWVTAREHGAKIKIVTIRTDAKTASERGLHNVPKDSYPRKEEKLNKLLPAEIEACNVNVLPVSFTTKSVDEYTSNFEGTK